MDINSSTLIKLLLPLTPLILKTLILNALNLSKNAKAQDARTEVTINIIRKIVNVAKPLTFTQKLSLRDPGIKGPLWVSKVTIPPPPETDALELVLSAIKTLGDGIETFTTTSITPVEAEWTGYRSCVDKKAPRPELPESEHYTNLMKEVSSTVTVLYFHGGAYFLMDPASHRNTTSHLAKLTKGRCLSIRYRLAPQHPFPAQLLDSFISYLYLLSPPPSSHHTPVLPSSIIFSGDSAGGNLALALSLLITTLIRTGHTTIPFHGRSVTLNSPAGVALNSPWVDISHSLPSINAYAQYDYLDPPSPTTQPTPDALWPTSPPRAEIFCNASVLSHPLVSPLAATPAMWASHPPVWLVTGYEMLTDSILVTARRIAKSGTFVELVGYEGMPHCFGMVFPGTPAGRDCFARCARFCVDAVEGKFKDESQGNEEKGLAKGSKASWMKARSKPLAFREVRFEEISSLSEEEVDRLMAEKKGEAVEREAREIRAWEEGKRKTKHSQESEITEEEALVEGRAKL